MRRISVNARSAHDAASTDEIEVVLIQIEHPQLAAPVRLSTDPTERRSVDPLTYGTRSTWLGANPVTSPFLFILASAELPGDQEDAPASTALVLENVDVDLAVLLRSFTDRPTVHMAVVGGLLVNALIRPTPTWPVMPTSPPRMGARPPDAMLTTARRTERTTRLPGTTRITTWTPAFGRTRFQ